MITTLKRASMALMACASVVLMTTSCTKDDDTANLVNDVVGTYTGTTTVKVNGVDPGLPASPAKIKIEKSGDKVKLTLDESAYGDMLQGAVLSVDGVSVAGKKDNYTLSGSGDVAIGPLKVPVTISGSGPTNKMAIKIGVVMTDKMSVEVVFDGTKK